MDRCGVNLRAHLFPFRTLLALPDSSSSRCSFRFKLNMGSRSATCTSTPAGRGAGAGLRGMRLKLFVFMLLLASYSAAYAGKNEIELTPVSCDKGSRPVVSCRSGTCKEDDYPKPEPDVRPEPTISIPINLATVSSLLPTHPRTILACRGC